MEEIAADAPQPINKVLFLAFKCTRDPTLDPIAEPVTNMGASSPTDPPNPTVIAEVNTRL